MTRQLGKYVLLIGLALLLAASQSALAQRGPGGGGRNFGRLMGGWSKAALATLPDVQAELKMTDEQKTKTTEIYDKLASDLRELFGSSFGKFTETMDERDKFNREASAEVNKLLEPDQQKRLQEIAVQLNGPRVLYDASVVEQLQLTDEQKKQLDEAREDNSKRIAEVFSKQLSRDERREEFRKLAEEGDAKLLAVLTDEQSKKFDEMKGTPIDIDLSPLARRPRQ
jgi:Spy/CpxP family protein refolding chaperone